MILYTEDVENVLKLLKNNNLEDSKESKEIAIKTYKNHTYLMKTDTKNIIYQKQDNRIIEFELSNTFFDFLEATKTIKIRMNKYFLDNKKVTEEYVNYEKGIKFYTDESTKLEVWFGYVRSESVMKGVILHSQSHLSFFIFNNILNNLSKYFKIENVRDYENDLFNLLYISKLV